MTELVASAPYPVRLDVEYLEAQSRWKALFRLPLAIPLLIFTYLLSGGVAGAIIAAILVRGRIPRWLFDFQVGVNRWSLRALGYTLLLTDRYPPFEGDHAIQYAIDYPDRLSRWRLVFWKLISAIPHIIIVEVLLLTVLVVTLVGWFAILINGRFPRALQQYVAGVLRWGARVQAYVLSLTDAYPPFSLAADVGQAGRRSYVLASVLGSLAVAAVIGLFVTLLVAFAVGSQRIVTQVSYARLVAGATQHGEGIAEVHSGRFELRGAVDPAGGQYAFLAPAPGHRLIEFRFFMENYRGAGQEVPIRKERFELRDTGGDEHEPLIATVNRNRIAPFDVASGDTATLQLVFTLPAGADPVELEYRVLDYAGPFGETIVYEFE